MQITAKDGRIAIGYIAARDAERHHLARSRHRRRDEVRRRRDRRAESPSARFMPAGLVDRLSREDLRDLFRYLSELGKPK